MVTLHLSAEIGEDRKVVLTLPPDVPIGKVDLLVSIREQGQEVAKPPRTSLADWAEAQAGSWGDQLRATDVEAFTGRRF